MLGQLRTRHDGACWTVRAQGAEGIRLGGWLARDDVDEL